MFARLRRLLRTTHRLDRVLPSLTHADETALTRGLAELQARLERVVHDRQQTIDQAIEALLSVIGGVKETINSVSGWLRDSPNLRTQG
jgi:hypothetical protein